MVKGLERTSVTSRTLGQTRLLGIPFRMISRGFSLKKKDHFPVSSEKIDGGKSPSVSSYTTDFFVDSVTLIRPY